MILPDEVQQYRSCACITKGAKKRFAWKGELHFYCNSCLKFAREQKKKWRKKNANTSKRN